MIKKSVAIIGFGWLGKPLAIALRDNGYSVFVGSRSDEKITEINELNLFGFKLTYLDEHDIKISLNAAQINEIDFLVITIPPSGIKNYGLSLSQIATAFSVKTKIIFTSSTGIYQDVSELVNESGKVIENHPVFLAEQKLRNNLKDRLTIIRLAGLIGKNRHPVKYFVQKGLIPSGSSPVNLVRIEDVISAVILIIEKELSGEIFNIVNNEHPDRIAYYTNAANSLFKIQLKTENKRLGKTIDGTKFEHQTGFCYKYSIFEWDTFYITTELT